MHVPHNFTEQVKVMLETALGPLGPDHLIQAPPS